MNKSSIIDKGGGLDKARRLLSEQGVLRSRDFDAHGIGREYLRLLVERGDVLRLSRGVYVAADAPLSAHHILALCAQRVPEGVICLLSALLFHEIGTALPWQVWLAVGLKSHKPHLDYPPVQIVRFSPLALSAGVETHLLDGVQVKITSPARTVVDCFRYRHKIGLDVALEALREALAWHTNSNGVRIAPRCTRGEITELATKLRAANVMRPYLEAYSAT